MARRMHPLESGERDRQVVLQSRGADAGGSSGFPVVTWSALATVFMSKEDLRGQERFAVSQLAAKFDTRWEMNYRTDMDPELLDVPKLRRIVYQGRTYDIVEASMIGRREGVELLTIASTGVS